MSEWITNPQFWISSAVSAVMGAVLPYIYRLGRSNLQSIFSGAKGKVRAIYRARRCKRLKKIKAARFDSARINREIALSYALLILFIISGIIFFSGLASIPSKNYKLIYFLGAVTVIPVLLFEFAWLSASNRVDDILKSRKKIKRQERRLL